MSTIVCGRCTKARAQIKRPKTNHSLCKECFFYCFEAEIHQTIVQNALFERGQKIAIGASGGKDSTVLAYVLKLLNERYDYGINLFLLSIDEGIVGYRDDSLETVKQNQLDYCLPLKILSYQDLYGWTMDKIVEATGIKIIAHFAVCSVGKLWIEARCYLAAILSPLATMLMI
ncbi:hypothetical protein SSS_04522 [Sarcoptes scabiei]|nr:hypothetical protein SSS_04522 [Sarcoptes scabiei]